MALTTNLVAYYKFDENTGTSVGDSVGTNTGTYTGTGTAWATGKINSGGNFTSANSNHVDIPGLNNAINYAGFSISLWANFTSFGGNGRIAANSHTDVDNKGFQLFYTFAGGVEQLWLNIGNGTTNATAQATAGYTTGAWYHIVGVYDGAIITLYINGSSAATASLAGSIGAQVDDLWIGGNPAYSGDYIDSVVDEFGIWSRALTSTEVTSLYNSGAGLQYPFGGGVTVLRKQHLSLLGIG